MRTSHSHFYDVIRATGLEPPSNIEPGRLYRFPGHGKRSSNRAGWCLLFKDSMGGCFGDWSTGLKISWQVKHSQNCSEADQIALVRRIKYTKIAANSQRNAIQDAAAFRAGRIWKSAPLAPSNNPYLIRKRIQPHGARCHKGLLTLPVVDFKGKLTSLQFISTKGSKRLLSGGRKKGCFIPITAMMTNPSHVIICEGWATGCTLAEDNPNSSVLVAIDSGNLEPVSLAARRQWPSVRMVIAGDDDKLTTGNPGATKAKAAAIVAGALLALPQWPVGAPNHLSDFNDLKAWLAEQTEQGGLV